MNFFAKMGLVNAAPEEVEEQTTEKNSSVKNTEEKQTPAPAQEVKKSKLSFAPLANTVSGQVVGNVDNDIFEKLSSAIEENNLPGNDFLEFMQSLTKMSSVSAAEKDKMNMVFATLSTSDGMTKDHLVKSIDHYLNVIESERKGFQKEMQRKLSEEVEQKDAYVEQLSTSAKEKNEQIQKLTEEIQKISDEIAVAKTESSNSKIFIEQKQADFEVTVAQLQAQILDYKTKIEQHIQ